MPFPLAAAKTVTINGETKTVSEWAKQIGVSPQAMYHRFSTWPAERWLEPAYPLQRSQDPRYNIGVRIHRI